MYNPRAPDQQVSAELESHFGAKVYRTIVPAMSALPKAPTASRSSPSTKFEGAQAYSALARKFSKGSPHD